MTPIIVVVCVLVAGSFAGWYWNTIEWNKGFCSKCNDSWEYFDTDSQGGRGYKCGCGRHIWISWLNEKAHAKVKRNNNG